MPELPDVELARRVIENRALGRRIADVEDSDVWVCRPHAPGEIAGALKGAALTDAHRHAWLRRAAEELLAAAGGGVVVETGLPLWQPERADGYVATYGAGRANLDAAAERLLRGP